MFQVQKRDGRLEDFDRNKVVGGVLKAGGSNDDAEKVTAAIETWLPTAAINGVVKAEDLGAKGLEVLRTVNPAAAAAFEAYRNRKAQGQ